MTLGLVLAGWPRNLGPHFTQQTGIEDAFTPWSGLFSSRTPPQPGCTLAATRWPRRGDQHDG
jgi:hypothetical protein